jgi:hypothetical protein
MEMETPQPEDLDSEEHDAFGGAPPPPADHDVDWRPDRPARRPLRKWIAGLSLRPPSARAAAPAPVAVLDSGRRAVTSSRRHRGT